MSFESIHISSVTSTDTYISLVIMESISNEKVSSVGFPHSPRMLPSRPTSRPKRRTLYVCLATVVSCLWLLHLCFGTEPDNGLSSDKKEYTGSAQQLPISHVPTEQELNVEAAGLEEATNEKKIPLEAHIMSKCPDAKDCLRDLIVPAMERIVDKVNFRLSFIGE